MPLVQDGLVQAAHPKSMLRLEFHELPRWIFRPYRQTQTGFCVCRFTGHDQKIAKRIGSKFGETPMAGNNNHPTNHDICHVPARSATT
jgi:hypothetical protein